MSVLGKVCLPVEEANDMLVEASRRLFLVAQVARVNAVVHKDVAAVVEVLENILSLATNGREGHLSNQLNVSRETIEIAHIIASRSKT